MKTDIIRISREIHLENTVHSVISLKKFIEFLKENILNGNQLKTPYFKWALKKIEKFSELSGPVSIEKIGDYQEILELISTCLLPLASDEKTLWGLSKPLSPEIFYSTDGFYESMKYLKFATALDPDSENVDGESKKIIQELQYGQVLEKFYQLPYLKKTEWVRKFIDPETGLDKYFLVHIDNRFVDILPIGALPEYGCSVLNTSPIWSKELNKVNRSLPLNRFEARGFSLISLMDVTAQQAIENFGKLIIDNRRANMPHFFQAVTHSLQTIIDSIHYQFGIVPFLSINDRPALLYENYPFSIIIQACWQFELSKKEFTLWRNDFARNPRPVVWSAKDRKEELPELIGQALTHAGINTYMLFPVFHNQAMTGIFEISSKDEQPTLNAAQLVKLQPVFPLIAQMIQNIIGRFNATIENIIKDKFTSIQPAVQWKFNETAWHYLRDHLMEDKDDPLEDISFRELHPLYGTLDIRNSTLLQNQALEKDFRIQLSLLTETLSALRNAGYPGLEHLLESAKNWLQIVRNPLTTQQEIRLNEFFNLEALLELESLLASAPETKPIVQPYLSAIDARSGSVFKNRRRLEAAFQELNNTVNNFYDNAAAELLDIYPCYFEKFRTDGVEYDIYLGQSIAPQKPFLKEYLQQMKRWQLQSMIKLMQLTEGLTQVMDDPIETTQLLYVHPQTIDITFRKDERRFDVEGTYNIRYQVIKKRIDKIMILHSQERLTQPGKIAVAYFNDGDALEYKGYIRELQRQELLLDDLEELDLEAMQGVDGLKALRVGVHRQTRSRLLQ